MPLEIKFKGSIWKRMQFPILSVPQPFTQPLLSCQRSIQIHHSGLQHNGWLKPKTGAWLGPSAVPGWDPQRSVAALEGCWAPRVRAWDRNTGRPRRPGCSDLVQSPPSSCSRGEGHHLGGTIFTDTPSATAEVLVYKKQNKQAQNRREN